MTSIPIDAAEFRNALGSFATDVIEETTQVLKRIIKLTGENIPSMWTTS